MTLSSLGSIICTSVLQREDGLSDASALFQLNNPTLVEGLVLINVDPCAEGWIDWAASKVDPSSG